jgi:hypothetical protein
MFYEPETLHKGIEYLLSLDVIFRVFAFALAMVLLGLYALYEDKNRRAGFDQVDYFTKTVFLLILGMWWLSVLLYDLIRLPFMYYLSKSKEQIEAQNRAQMARRQADEMQRVADIRAKEKQQADDIRRISRQYQSHADQLYAKFVNDMSNK